MNFSGFNIVLNPLHEKDLEEMSALEEADYKRIDKLLSKYGLLESLVAIRTAIAMTGDCEICSIAAKQDELDEQDEEELLIHKQQELVDIAISNVSICSLLAPSSISEELQDLWDEELGGYGDPSHTLAYLSNYIRKVKITAFSVDQHENLETAAEAIMNVARLDKVRSDLFY